MMRTQVDKAAAIVPKPNSSIAYYNKLHLYNKFTLWKQQ